MYLFLPNRSWATLEITLRKALLNFRPNIAVKICYHRFPVILMAFTVNPTTSPGSPQSPHLTAAGISPGTAEGFSPISSDSSEGSVSPPGSPVSHSPHGRVARTFSLRSPSKPLAKPVASVAQTAGVTQSTSAASPSGKSTASLPYSRVRHSSLFGTFKDWTSTTWCTWDNSNENKRCLVPSEIWSQWLC